MFPVKELPVYNVMISAYGSHGFAEEAFGLCRQLVEEGLKPDSITFRSVLSSCSHAELVREGLVAFRDMISLYGMKPSSEHYGSVLTLLSRKGNEHGVLTLCRECQLNQMPVYWDHFLLLVWKLRRQVEEQIAESLLRMEPDNAGNCVAVSNAHAALGRCSEVSHMRNLIRKRPDKNPGCSWIEIGIELHVFLAGERSHLKSPEILSTLAFMEMEMRYSC